MSKIDSRIWLFGDDLWRYLQQETVERGRTRSGAYRIYRLTHTGGEVVYACEKRWELPLDKVYKVGWLRFTYNEFGEMTEEAKALNLQPHRYWHFYSTLADAQASLE